MKVLKQFSLLDINPVNVDSIRSASAIPELIKYCPKTWNVCIRVEYGGRLQRRTINQMQKGDTVLFFGPALCAASGFTPRLLEEKFYE